MVDGDNDGNGTGWQGRTFRTFQQLVDWVLAGAQSTVVREEAVVKEGPLHVLHFLENSGLFGEGLHPLLCLLPSLIPFLGSFLSFFLTPSPSPVPFTCW